jgi:hypothetical protein
VVKNSFHFLARYSKTIKVYKSGPSPINLYDILGNSLRNMITREFFFADTYGTREGGKHGHGSLEDLLIHMQDNIGRPTENLNWKDKRVEQETSELHKKMDFLKKR